MSRGDHDLGRVVLFPFSKEVHTLVRFADLLPASIRPVSVVDFTCPPTDAGVALGLPRSGLPVHGEITCLDDADTLLVFWSGVPLEHFARLYAGRRVWQRFTALLRRAQRRGMRIVSLVEPAGKLVAHCLRHGIEMEVWRGTSFAPTQRILPDNRLTTRRLGIAGTAPCVGKFTTALFLQRELAGNGVGVGSIATEQAGALLCDVALANRPDVDLRVHVAAALSVLQGTDIIISAGQGGILDGGLPIYNRPWTIGYQLHHFNAFRPHDVVLVVRPGDDVRTIRDSITTIELMSRGRRPAALVLPEVEEVAYQRYRRASPRALTRTHDRLTKLFRVPAFVVRSDGTGARELARHVQRLLG